METSKLYVFKFHCEFVPVLSLSLRLLLGASTEFFAVSAKMTTSATSCHKGHDDAFARQGNYRRAYDAVAFQINKVPHENGYGREEKRVPSRACVG